MVDIKKIAAEKGLKIGKPSINFFSLMICEEKLVSEFIGISHNESINLFLKKIKLQRELSLARRIVFIIPYSCFVKSYRDRLKPMIFSLLFGLWVAFRKNFIFRSMNSRIVTSDPSIWTVYERSLAYIGFLYPKSYFWRKSILLCVADRLNSVWRTTQTKKLHKASHSSIL